MTSPAGMFDTVDIPADDDVSEADLVPITFGTDDDVLTCQECGKPLTYGGRGRKPKFCDEHKKTPSKPRGGGGARRGGDATAQEAADILTQVNGMLGLALMLPTPLQMSRTAAALEERGDAFNEAAFDALKASPELARTIARAGGVSGSAGLIIAYGMLVAGIAPMIKEDLQAKRKPVDNEAG